MKVWFKYFIGIGFGFLAAFLLPWNNVTGASIINFVNTFCIRFGRYLVVPLVFCTAIVSFNKLKMSKVVLKTSLWTAGIIVLSSFLLTLIGMVSVLSVKLPRIPITVDVTTKASTIDFQGMLLSLFPNSAFEALLEGSFLLVAFLFAILIGRTCFTDQNTFKPIYTLSDSLSQLFYKLSSGFSEILSVLMIALTCYWTIQFKSTFASGVFNSMFVLIFVDFLLVAGVIYPLIIRYVCKEPHPYRVLYASLAPIMVGFVTGDENFVFPIVSRHAKESLGIKRRSAGLTLPLFSIFSRGGAALVATISFVSIWRSYSSLKFEFGDIMFIFFLAFSLSFFLGGLPSGGAFVLVTILCQTYAKGFEASYVLLMPASLVICSFSTLFNVVTSIFGSYIVAVKTNMVEHHQLFRFI